MHPVLIVRDVEEELVGYIAIVLMYWGKEELAVILNAAETVRCWQFSAMQGLWQMWKIGYCCHAS